MRPLTGLGRLGAAAQEAEVVAGLKAAGNPIDRKILADLAVTSPAAFATLAKVAADARPAAPTPATQ